MFMKKSISIILISTVLIALLVGCGSQKAASPSVEQPKEKTEQPKEKTEQPKEKSNYPTRPITLVCPWSAGGSSDLSCRALSSIAEKYLGVPMNVVNREGGNGALALTELSKEKADGYNICIASSGNFTVMPQVQDLEFDIDSFTSLIATTIEPLAVAVMTDSDINSIDDIKALNKKIIYGMSGQNGSTHLGAKRLFKAAGIEEEVMPFGGASKAIAALLGGHVEIIIVHPGMLIPQVESGKVKIISMIYSKRSDFFPDVETCKEQGYGDISVQVIKILLAPKDLDPEIREFLTSKLLEMTQDPSFETFCKNNGLETSDLMGDVITENIKKEAVLLTPIIKDAGLAK